MIGKLLQGTSTRGQLVQDTSITGQLVQIGRLAVSSVFEPRTQASILTTLILFGNDSEQVNREP